MKQLEEAPQRTLVIAYLEDHPKTITVLRAARKRAHEKNMRWRAVYIETPAITGTADEGAHERMLRLLTLATQMGGETTHVEAQSMEEGLQRVLETEKDRLALCIVGSSELEHSWRWWGTRKRSAWQKAVSVASRYTAVETLPLSGRPFTRSMWPKSQLPSLRFPHIAYALIAVGVAYAFAALMEWALPPALFRINSQNVTLLFMIACSFIASRYGLLPGLVAAVGGFVTANYSYNPHMSLVRVVSVTDALNMALFLFAAVLIAVFTSQARSYAERASRRELSTQALFMLYRIASNSFSREQALEKVQRKLTRMLDMEVAFFLPTPGLAPASRIELAFPTDLTLSENDLKALDSCWTDLKTTGLGSPINPGTNWRFEPMMAPGGEFGVIAVSPRGARLDSWYGKLLTAIADQTASVLEHIELERSMEATRLREEREKLRGMLLSSVSHDLKTPLAGIIGAISVFQSLGDRLPAARRDDLMETALEEAHRLDSFITNILDMTRLESGKIEFHVEWHDMPRVIEQIGKRMEHRLRQHRLQINNCPSDIEVRMDVMMTEQVLQNLVDNACKYTAHGTLIEITCHIQENAYIVEVRDHGKGLPPDKLAQVFDKYARLHKEDSQIAGTGLGLAICRAIMEAQGGWITAGNHPDGGAVFTLGLPQWRRVDLNDLALKKSVA